MPTPTIRDATDRDLASITEISNHYVRETAITFDLEPLAPEARHDWFAQFAETGPHRLLVADVEGAVAGYAYSTRVRPRAAYDGSVEVTQQRHTVALDRDSVESSADLELVWENMNDGTVEGIRSADGSAVGLQAVLAAPHPGAVNTHIKQFVEGRT